MIGYFELWRALKSLQIRSFNIDSREVENVIIRIFKLKERDLRMRREAAGDIDLEEEQ
jgi:hypothetical protein